MAQIYRPKHIVVVRHGESAWNAKFHGQEDAAQQMQGIPDHQTPLTQVGIEQAKKTGKALRELLPGGFDVIYYSPYIRTAETAKVIVAQFLDTQPGWKMQQKSYRNLFLTEQDFGNLDYGVGDPEKTRLAEEEFKRLRERVGKFYCRTPNGESWRDVCMRTHQFLGVLFQPNRNNQTILVVTHAVTMQTFRYHLERLAEEELVEEYEKDKIKNCGVSWYSYTDEKWACRFWNKSFL